MTKQAERIYAHREDFINRWMPQLLEKVERTEADLRSYGLQCSDFSSEGVRIDFQDGSFVQFQDAFHVVTKDEDGAGRRVAVFTEHCGYHEFELYSINERVGPIP